MKKRTVIFTTVTLILMLAANLPLAWGYFSTYTEASGVIRLQPWQVETDIKEEVSDWTKHVVITNSEDGSPVYIRAKAFGGSEYDLTYETGGSWTLRDDGFYYYNGILGPGEQTPELLVKINGLPEDAEKDQKFDVVVIYESTPVCYDKDGKPYADWGRKLEARERSAE